MTALQKEHIILLRSKGESYTSIATALGMSKNTITSFCRRSNLGINIEISNSIKVTEQRYCKQCGNELVQISGRKKRKFCSLSCRMTWWKDHPETLNRKAVYALTCACCGEVFSSYGNKGRKYCSHTCYVAHRFGKGTSI